MQFWFLNQEDLLEGEMVAHSNILAWEIPRTEEPTRLQSMELQRIGHDWVTKFRDNNNNNNKQHTNLCLFRHYLHSVKQKGTQQPSWKQWILSEGKNGEERVSVSMSQVQISKQVPCNFFFHIYIHQTKQSQESAWFRWVHLESVWHQEYWGTLLYLSLVICKITTSTDLWKD